MNLSRLFILRPVATSLLMVALLFSGVLAYRLLPVSALPEVDYPTIQVTTLYPGASPDVMTSSITAPLERQFGQMPGLKQMSSSSSGGASVITLQFNLSQALDVAEQEVQAAINAANTFLPNDLPMPPVYSKVNPADAPIITLAVTSDTLPLPQVEDLVDTRLAQKLSQLPGVGLVSMGGGLRPAVRVQANPVALAAHGMNLDDLRTAIGNANVNAAKGSFDGPLRASTLNVNDQLHSAAEYRDLVLAWKNGAPIYLRDVANVVDDAENIRLAAWANRQPAIILNVQRQPGANVIQTVDRIQQQLPQLQATLPNTVTVSVLTDRTTTIRASIHDVQWELLLAVLLVVAVIYVFLRSASATAIPAVAVPLSLVGTLGVMYLAGFSINNLTLMALTIAAGFVVDDAIVMIENISRYIEQGESPLNASLKGSQQIGFTILSLTFSLIAVLIPLLFMGDVVGRLFHEFAITLAVAILLSAVVSLTLTPMMCARLLRHTTISTPDKVKKDWFSVLLTQYDSSLQWVLSKQKIVLLVAIGTLLVTALLYVLVPKGFFPAQDTGVIQVIAEAPQSISFFAMRERQQQVADIILRDPAVDSLSSVVGIDGVNTTLNSGRLLVNLKQKNERRISAQDTILRLQEKLKPLDGSIKIYLQPVQDLTIEDRISRTQYQLSVQDANADELAHWVPIMMEQLTKISVLRDVAGDNQDQGLQAYIEIDRAAAGRLGITVAMIDNALYNAFGQRLISTIFTQANLYRVVLEVQQNFRDSLSALEHLYVIAPEGGRVPLLSVARVTEKTAPLAIHHIGQFPATTLSFNLAPHASLGSAIHDIRNTLQAMNMPASVEWHFQGAAEAFQDSLGNTLWLILAAIVVMYIVLGVLYESFIHPVTILSTLPSAAVGALLALQLTGNDLDVIAVIGIVLLIGIVKKNAIMVVDFALQAEREQNKTAQEAVYEACLLRFRPILMTTLCALLGALPLMLGTGVGSELRHPLGVTLVGGLVFSQLLTLFTTPVIYLAFDRLRTRSRA